MGLRYPFLLILLAIGFIAFLFISKKQREKYKTGSKISNTYFLKSTAYYKNKIRSFKFFRNLLFGFFAVSLISSAVLISRPFNAETENLDEYNRDIFLCMDVSTSVDELNLELVSSLENTVDKLNGERFGISIFNTSSVVLSPLTDDYDYIKEILEKIKKSIEINNSSSFDYDDNWLYYGNYVQSGTLEGNEQRGSSLIGDGLASCVYSFSNLDEERTRLIIFSTDNDLEGKPLVTLSQAGTIAKEKNVKVFGIGTKIMESSDRSEYKEAVEKTGGKFYEHSSDTVNNIVSDIEKTSKSLLRSQTETKEFDTPLIPFILLIISVLLTLIFARRVAK